MGVKDLMSPAIILELKYTNMAVGRSASKKAPTLVRSPGDHVHRGCVEGEIKDLCPGVYSDGGCCVLMLLAPDEDLSIIRRGGQNCTKFWVCLESEERKLLIQRFSYDECKSV